MPEALPETYRAWTWVAGEAPLALVLATRPMPRPGPGEVIVRNAAIGLNPVDWKVLGRLGWQPGHVPGVDGAGTVVKIGPDVDPAWLGSRVAYHQSLQSHGSFAQYTPVGTYALMRVPDALDLALAASMPCPALTAWRALAKLPPGSNQRMLVSGAGGAVGNYLVQLAVQAGWRVSVMCNIRHRERLAGLGAVDWIPGPLTQDAEIGSTRFTAVIDAVGPEHAARLHPGLKANGHLVCIQGRVPDWPSPAFGRALSLHEVALGALHKHGDTADWSIQTSAGEDLFAQVAAKTLAPEPLVPGPFEDLPRLLEALRNRDFSGKPVIGLA